MNILVFSGVIMSVKATEQLIGDAVIVSVLSKNSQMVVKVIKVYEYGLYWNC